MAEYIEREALALSVLGLEIVNPVVEQYANAVLWHIQQAPAADVAPVRRGRWIEKEDWAADDYYYTCSVCGEDFVLIEGSPGDNLWNHCPNCGAKMDLED